MEEREKNLCLRGFWIIVEEQECWETHEDGLKGWCRLDLNKQ
jgi:hypothetical protein